MKKLIQKSSAALVSFSFAILSGAKDKAIATKEKPESKEGFSKRKLKQAFYKIALFS